MSPLYRLIYCSRNAIEAPPAVMDAEIAAILATSRRNNQRNSITGALIYSADCFAQALEGERELVEATFERIEMDSRNEDAIVLSFEAVDRRLFESWAMIDGGLAEAEDAAILAAGLAGANASDEAIGKLLRSLVRRDSNWLTLAA